MTSLLSVDQAIHNILATLATLPGQRVPLLEAAGRVLAQEVVAAEDLPPFAASSMDGYAVRSVDCTEAAADSPTRLRVVMDIPAGTFPRRAIGPGEAARIMTGAPVPQGADAVIPVEDTDSDFRQTDDAPLPEAVGIYRSTSPGGNVRPVGENVRTGQVVLPAGRVLGAADIGMLAALGHAEVLVVRQPRVAIISTGDELVEVEQQPGPGQIRDSNGYVLHTLVAESGGVPLRLPIARDRLEAVRGVFRDALAQQPDLILSSAGVSVGTADLVRTVLDELGRVNLWRINLRPGKPLAYGELRGVPFFGLPGNPVSVMVTYAVLVRPALDKLGGRANSALIRRAVAQEELHSDGRRSYLRVTLRPGDDGQLAATTTGTQSSGALMSMVLADGLLIIPEGVKHVPRGTELDVQLLREIGQ